MIERFGEGRFIQELGIQPIQQDECGTLYRLELPPLTPFHLGNIYLKMELEYDEPLVMVSVKDSSSEHELFQRVPPNIQTACEAVAWILGMTAYEYKPDKET